MNSKSPLRRILILITLVIAGEVVFLLPFVFPRIFRPTVLDVFGLTNLELGSAFSVYGMAAILCYFIGGPLADRFPARNLMSIALLCTAALGGVMATIPSYPTIVILYGGWGVTTILLFWAAMIRATRLWGSESQQGIAYGLLDGGRGLVAAIIASSSVMLLAAILPIDVANASMELKSQAVSKLIWSFVGVTIVAALLVLIIIPAQISSEKPVEKSNLRLQGVLQALKTPSIWLQAVIVLCAYVGYKATDDFSLFARDAFGYDDVEAARIGTITFWMRPLAAVTAGYFADKIKASNVIKIGFVLMAGGSLAIGFGIVQPGLAWMLITTIIVTSVGIYALRGVYFALIGESKVPVTVTGSVVGIVSVVGFLPDVFMGPWMGYLLDASPGALGHQHVFILTASFALLGFLATVMFQRVMRPTN